VQPVSYGGRLVAGVAADKVVLSSCIAPLEDDHPRSGFVLAMCTLAAEQAGSKRPCDDAAAERLPGRLLMSERAWRRRPATATLEQVRRRRTELARTGWRQLAPEAI
jgi:hypothetical protein